MLSRRAAIVFGGANLLTGGLIVLGVFAGLPSRWLPVDGPAVVLAGLEGIAGAALLAGARLAERVALVASTAALAVGLGLVTALALTASWLRGVYGPIGMGGAVILALVAALCLPYLVALPVVQLVWLRAAPDEVTRERG